MNRIEAMQSRLNALEPISLQVIDESAQHAGHAGARDGGGHFVLHIVSALFAGKSTVARHRMVYSALGEMMKRDIHALTIEAKTPTEI